MRFISCLVLCLSCFFMVSVAQADLTPDTPLKICITNGDWPPYVYYERSGDLPPERLVGLSKNSIDLIFKKLGYRYEIHPVIWSRVTHLSSNTLKKCDFVWDIPSTSAADLNMNVSSPIYKINFSVLYDHDLIQESTLIANPLDVFLSKKADFCGIRGYNYRVLNNLIHYRVKDTNQALRMLERKRCNLFISSNNKLEFGLQNHLFALPKNVNVLTMSHYMQAAYYIGVNKNNKRANQILKQINTELQELIQSGRWQSLFSMYNIQHNLTEKPL